MSHDFLSHLPRMPKKIQLRLYRVVLEETWNKWKTQETSQVGAYWTLEEANNRVRTYFDDEERYGDSAEISERGGMASAEAEGMEGDRYKLDIRTTILPSMSADLVGKLSSSQSITETTKTARYASSCPVFKPLFVSPGCGGSPAPSIPSSKFWIITRTAFTDETGEGDCETKGTTSFPSPYVYDSLLEANKAARTAFVAMGREIMGVDHDGSANEEEGLDSDERTYRATTNTKDGVAKAKAYEIR